MLSPHIAEGGIMPNLRAYSMALFGQIDQIAIEADQDPSPANDAVLDTVGNLLPNSTGLGQRGWYSELQEFLNSPKVREGSQPFAFPEFSEATEALSGMPRLDRSSIDFVPPDEDRHPALARAAYASVILEKVRLVKEAYGATRDSEQPAVVNDARHPRFLAGGRRTSRNRRR